MIAVDDPRSSSPVSYRYDPANRLTQVTGADGGVTRYTYDMVGDLTSRTDDNGHTSAYSYNDRHQLTTVTNPLDRKVSYGYDPEGHLEKIVTARGPATGDLAAWTITQAWDERGLRTAITADAVASASYGYSADGRLTRIDDSTGTTTLGYFADGLLKSVAHPQGNYSYDYAPNGELTRRSYPDGTDITYTRDADDLVDSLTADGLTAGFGYNLDGQLNKITYPAGNGHTQTRSYDRTGLLSSIINKRGSAAPLSRFDYTRDPAGNPIRIETTRGSNTSNDSYTYDPANRLNKVCFGASCATATRYIDYNYDKVGNRLSESRVGVSDPGTIAYGYNAADQMISRGDTTYNYNADGQLLNGRSWDVLGRMTARTIAGTTSTFGYDGMGLRRTVTTGGATRSLSWDVNNPLPMLGQVTRSDGVAFSQRYAPDGTPLWNSIPGTNYPQLFFHHDGLGSVTDVTTGTGDPAWRYSYEPYGTQTEAAKLLPGVTEPGRGYTGEYWEPRNLALHLRARDYDPATGRFSSTDPLAPAIADPYVSAYAYANNQPTLYTDPTGACPWCVVSTVVGAIGGATVASFEYGRSYDDFSFRDWGTAVGAGATFGAGTAVLGTGTAATVASSAAAGTAGTTVVTGLAEGRLPSGREAAISAVTGGIFGGVTALACRAAAAGAKPFNMSTSWQAPDRAAANGGSRLAEASSSAFRAADNVGDWTVSAKHLPGAGGRWNKWAEGVDINGTVANALRSEGASFLPNAGAVTDRFVVRTNMGTVVGTRGETVVKAVVSNDGHIITTYPVK